MLQILEGKWGGKKRVRTAGRGTGGLRSKGTKNLLVCLEDVRDSGEAQTVKLLLRQDLALAHDIVVLGSLCQCPRHKAHVIPNSCVRCEVGGKRRQTRIPTCFLQCTLP